MTQDLTPLKPEDDALLTEGLGIMADLDGSESPVELSAYYFRLAGIIASLPAERGTSRQHIDRASLIAYAQGVAVGLTVLGRHIHPAQEAPSV